MKKKALLIAAVTLAMSAGCAVTSMAAGWSMENGSWVYLDSSGDHVYNEWRRGADNLWRYLDGYGQMALSTWVDDEYYVDANGIMVTGGWQQLDVAPNGDSSDTHWYYFQESGKVVTDRWMKISGKWYHFDPDGVMETGWVDDDMYFCVDGLRLDVADEVSHVLWRELKKAVNERFPQAILIGEVWHESNMYLGGEFDGVMNYKLQKIFADYFAGGILSAEEAAEKINRVVMSHRRQTNAMMLNFLDNHDTPRFLRLCGENEENVRAALVALYFSAGIPCVLYGTELPLAGDGDPDCRRTYDWSQKPRHALFLRELARTRKAHTYRRFYRTWGLLLHSP